MPFLAQNWLAIVLTLVGVGVSMSPIAGWAPAIALWALAVAVAVYTNWRTMQWWAFGGYLVISALVGSYALLILSGVTPLLWSAKTWETAGLSLTLLSLAIYLYSLRIKRAGPSKGTDIVPPTSPQNPFEERVRSEFEFNLAGAERAKKAHELLIYRSEQMGQWHSFVRLELTGVNCYNAQAATPYIKVTFQVRNYLLESWILTNIEDGAGELRTKAHGTLNLPPLRLKKPISVDRCSEVEFTLTVYINGTDIPGPLFSASMANEEIAWLSKGVWKLNVHDSIRDGWTPHHELRWTGVPVVGARVG